jgi:NAD(P)-dependent dehydrogenase (short-subunit alcohol dehydrogenase family)
VNAVAPGPVTTPLTKETFDEEKEDKNKPPFERNATPEEIATSFFFWQVKRQLSLQDRFFIPMEESLLTDKALPYL